MSQSAFSSEDELPPSNGAIERDDFSLGAEVMVRGDAIPSDVVEEVASIAAARGCELIAAELKGQILRFVLDRPDEGVTVDDCAKVSREASAALDVMDFGGGRYTLEVSSPGLDRELYKPRDYERFTGHRVRVSYTVPETGAKRTVRGDLIAFRPDAEEIDVRVDEGNELATIPLSRIRVARLEIEL